MSTSSQFAGKIIALTGAASGIGRATATLLASRGAKLSLADLHGPGLAKVKDEIQERYAQTEIFIAALDVRDATAVEDWITATANHFGRLDGAANLAGIVPKSVGISTIADQDQGEWDAALGINLTGVMHCLRAQLKVMQDGASIINASSIAGLQGRPKNAAYAASKHGVVGLSRSAAKEAGPSNIRINAICPGRIDTPMSRMATSVASDTDEAIKISKETVRTGLRPLRALLTTYPFVLEHRHISKTFRSARRSSYVDCFLAQRRVVLHHRQCD